MTSFDKYFVNIISSSLLISLLIELDKLIYGKWHFRKNNFELKRFVLLEFDLFLFYLLK